MINFTPQLFGIKVAFLFCYSSEYDAMGKKAEFSCTTLWGRTKHWTRLSWGWLLRKSRLWHWISFCCSPSLVYWFETFFSILPPVIQQITCKTVYTINSPFFPCMRYNICCYVKVFFHSFLPPPSPSYFSAFSRTPFISLPIMLSEAIFSHLLDVCYRSGVLNELSFSIMQFYYQSIPQCNVVTFLNKKISLSESCKIVNFKISINRVYWKLVKLQAKQ